MQKPRHIIALDVDGCLQDCNSYVMSVASQLFNRPMPPVSQHWRFEFEHSLGLSEREKEQLHEEICRTRPTLDIKWLPGAIEFVTRLLSHGHDVFFLTSHWRGCPRWVTDREERLRLYWPKCDVVFAHNKARCRYDYLLDDKTENVLAAETGPREPYQKKSVSRGVLFDQPWNQSAPANLRRVKSYDEFFKLLDMDALEAKYDNRYETEDYFTG